MVGSAPASSSLLTILCCWLRTATASAVCPLVFFRFMIVPASISASTTSTWPHALAFINAVSPAYIMCILRSFSNTEGTWVAISGRNWTSFYLWESVLIWTFHGIIYLFARAFSPGHSQTSSVVYNIEELGVAWRWRYVLLGRLCVLSFNDSQS